MSQFEVTNRELYTQPDRKPMRGGCLDPRLGTSDSKTPCETCGLPLANCVGHFGYVKLELPVFHVGYFKNILTVLQCICKSCCHILLSLDDQDKFLSSLRKPSLDATHRKGIVKKIVEKAKKNARCCPNCGVFNGSVKKVPPLKLVHFRYAPVKKNEEIVEAFHARFEEAIKYNKDMKPFLGKAQEDLNPLRVLGLFERIPDHHCELLDFHPDSGRPELMILTHVLVPPVCIRPSVIMDAGQGSNEDDLTIKLTEIIHMNTLIEGYMKKGSAMNIVMEDWDFLQIQCALYINSETPGMPTSITRGKPTRKTGRFRGNLSGKRVDFSSRTVISPDPNLSIDEVAIPEYVAKILTFPEPVNRYNKERLQNLIRNGAMKHPGANFVINGSGNGMKRSLKYGKLDEIADNLSIGDVVERHLADGDIVLFNRQPSLHRISIMGHRVRVRPWKTFRLNVCCCTPYNADFDGDEMNVHVPQTQEARAEAEMLMGVVQNLITPRSGEPLVAPIQDFLTCAFLITKKDRFFTREEFCQICSFMSDGKARIQLPLPTLFKPVELWTGKQVFGVLIDFSDIGATLLNHEVRSRTYSLTKDDEETRFPWMDPADGYVIFRRSVLMCGAIDKSIVGDGKNSIFHTLLRDVNPRAAAERMNRLAKLASRFMANFGFSIGISDVQPSLDLFQKRKQVVEEGYAACEERIAQYQAGTLPVQAGSTPSETLEAVLTGELSKIRDTCGKLCLKELHHFNSPLIMALCGSKGSPINISQMIACVGQQALGGARIPNGFTNRTLPHFPVNSKTPQAKGFVANSFYSGISPTEFFFHTMTGREGLVDTAVKTAETGYMQRRLIKALEDLSVQYDYTVRTATGIVIQFEYGADNLIPSSMEAKDKPIDFNRVLEVVRSQFPDPGKSNLDPAELQQLVEAELGLPRWKPTSPVFQKDINAFFLNPSTGYIPKQQALRERWLSSANSSPEVVDCISRLTKAQLARFFDLTLEKYHRAVIEPGEAVGALAAQSIGEPATQMTLKTFHFAGVASMNITLGVPRIKEIINASKTISTPIITGLLITPDNLHSATIVKARIEKTTLGQVIKHIKQVYSSRSCYISIKLDMSAIGKLCLDITNKTVAKALLDKKKSKLRLKDSQIQTKGKSTIHISAPETSPELLLHSLHELQQSLPDVIVCGVPTARAAVLSVTQEKPVKKYELLVEGSGLQEVMTTPGIDGLRTKSNHIIEVEQVLGIEAARQSIINEIQYTMKEHGIVLDIRHVMLLAELMCSRGRLLGITRFGVGEMKDSVLMLASFEKTTDHLFDAAVHHRTEPIEGVSECIIMGAPIPLGTGLFKLLQQTERPVPNPRATLLSSYKQLNVAGV